MLRQEPVDIFILRIRISFAVYYAEWGSGQDLGAKAPLS
jgi:hypothetical protein